MSVLTEVTTTITAATTLAIAHDHLKHGQPAIHEVTKPVLSVYSHVAHNAAESGETGHSKSRVFLVLVIALEGYLCGRLSCFCAHHF